MLGLRGEVISEGDGFFQGFDFSEFSEVEALSGWLALVGSRVMDHVADDIVGCNRCCGVVFCWVSRHIANRDAGGQRGVERTVSLGDMTEAFCHWHSEDFQVCLVSPLPGGSPGLLGVSMLTEGEATKDLLVESTDVDEEPPFIFPDVFAVCTGHDFNILESGISANLSFRSALSGIPYLSDTPFLFGCSDLPVFSQNGDFSSRPQQGLHSFAWHILILAIHSLKLLRDGLLDFWLILFCLQENPFFGFKGSFL